MIGIYHPDIELKSSVWVIFLILYLEQKIEHFSNICIDKQLFCVYNNSIQNNCLEYMFEKWGLGDKSMCRRKKSVLTICLTVCLILALAITFGSFLSKAKNKEPEVTYYKYYTNIEIRPGDTLWDLADAYLENYDSKEEYIREVSQLNSIKNGKIISGQNLIMPYYFTEYKL